MPSTPTSAVPPSPWSPQPGRGAWVLALLSGDELAAQAADVDDELDVALAVGDSALGASTARADGVAVDLDAVPTDARTVRPFAIEGGPLVVTVADLDGLAGGGWREPGLLLGAGIALSVLVGALVLVLAHGRAGALIVASEAERARDRSEENFRAVVQHLSDLVVVTDADRVIGFVAPSVARLLGREAAALSGFHLGELVHPDDRALLASLTSRSGVSEKGLIRLRHSDGSYRSFEVVVANRLDDPAIGGLVLTGHDVTDRVQLEDRLAHDATHDDLTGLPNRALIHDRLEHALVRSERTGSRVAVVFGDLDGFKAVNDRYGHRAGDRLLRGVAHRLRGAARAVDTVGRYAGDEFVVICEDLDGEAGARLAAERLQREMTQPLDVDGRPVDVGMSLGVALAEPGETAESAPGPGRSGHVPGQGRPRHLVRRLTVPPRAERAPSGPNRSRLLGGGWSRRGRVMPCGCPRWRPTTETPTGPNLGQCAGGARRVRSRRGRVSPRGSRGC